MADKSNRQFSNSFFGTLKGPTFRQGWARPFWKLGPFTDTLNKMKREKPLLSFWLTAIHYFWVQPGHPTSAAWYLDGQREEFLLQTHQAVSQRLALWRWAKWWDELKGEKRNLTQSLLLGLVSYNLAEHRHALIETKLPDWKGGSETPRK